LHAPTPPNWQFLSLFPTLASAVPCTLLIVEVQSFAGYRQPASACLVTRDCLDHHWLLLPQLRDCPGFHEQGGSVPVLGGRFGHSPKLHPGGSWLCHSRARGAAYRGRPTPIPLSRGDYSLQVGHPPVLGIHLGVGSSRLHYLGQLF
jgi:hypothetical protein